MTRRFVLPLLDVRGHALDAGTTPEVTDGHAHRLRRDSLVAPVFPHPPACFDFVGGDSLDAIARETQLGGAKKAVVPDVPDCPWTESVLSPLQLSGAGVTQRIVRLPRRSCVRGFVEPGKRRQDQSCRAESHRLLRRISYGASSHASHYCPNPQVSGPLLCFRRSSIVPPVLGVFLLVMRHSLLDTPRNLARVPKMLRQRTIAAPPITRTVMVDLRLQLRFLIAAVGAAVLAVS